MSVENFYTTDQIPIVFDYTRLFDGIGSYPAVLAGETVATGAGTCWTPDDRTFVSASKTDDTYSIIYTGGAGGEYTCHHKIETSGGKIVAWEFTATIAAPAC